MSIIRVFCLYQKLSNCDKIVVYIANYNGIRKVTFYDRALRTYMLALRASMNICENPLSN